MRGRTLGLDQSQLTARPEAASSEVHEGWRSENNQGY